MSARRSRRPKDRGPRKFSLGRAMFVLPNLFTIASIFCSFHGMLLAATGGIAQLHRAALAIFFAIFFDMADGRVARLTRTQSDFGVQLDSLADVISFGVAPAFILHRFCLVRLGAWGAFLAFAYVAAGAIRLARFNVLAARGAPGGTSYFVGLPIPVAAGVLMSLVMYEARGLTPLVTRSPRAMWLMLLVGGLMVSNVRYRTFKDVKLTAINLFCGLSLVGIFLALALTGRSALAMLSYSCTYVALGLAEEAWALRLVARRLLGSQALALSATNEAGEKRSSEPPTDD